MAPLSITLFDDRRAGEWEPFTLTRPAGELLFGTLTFRQRAERLFGAPVVAHLSAAEHLHHFEEEGSPPVRPYEAAATDGDRLFLVSRAVLDWSLAGRWTAPREGGPSSVGGVTAGWFSPAGEPPPAAEFLRGPPEGAAVVQDLPGRVLRQVWDLASEIAEQLTRDILALHPEPGAPSLPAGVHTWGEHPLIVHPSARIEPGAVVDTSAGPVWLDEGSAVHAFTRLCGPAYIGPGSKVLGGSVECVAIGPVCRVRGELSGSVFLGYSNKQHQGHIGHAYLGRWVNLGAETTNSDLKNNYGTIRVWTPSGERNTGEIKLGCLLGDHVKTGIGLLLNTGTVVGTGSNLYGAELPPRFVPPFSWGSGEELVEYRLDKFLEVAERAMQRRNVQLTEGQRAQLEAAYAYGRTQART